ncbi:MAG: ABC transporter permease [Anaerolineaceae bacterium]|nr:ABC transporter permease [Anaerolineaceae bacterium]
MAYVARRSLMLVPTIFIISILTFLIMQAPPGDFMTAYIATREATGEQVDIEQVEALRAAYGLDQPWYEQYRIWITSFIQGDLGVSFEWNRPVTELIGQRLALTIFISILTILFTWFLAVAIGIYSAVYQYSPFDYLFTTIGFLGLAVPNFMLALILMFFAFKYLGVSVGGLFSSEYVNAPWSVEKFIDLLHHIWIPIIVIGTSGTASLIRVMRANLLDELKKPYVVTAQAKGVPRWKAIFKYPVRMALNPLLSTIGWLLPAIISGDIIVSVVLSLQTIGPLYLRALQNQDMFLAGSILMILTVLTVFGTLISDLLLAWIDPRIQYR